MLKWHNFPIIILLFLSTHSAIANSPLGACIHDPNADVLQNKWKHYLEVKKKRAHINTALMVQAIRMDQETLKLLQAISEVENLMVVLDKLENNFLKKAFVDLRFNDMISHPDFLAKLAKKEVDAEIHSSELKFRDDPKFYELLDLVRAETTRPEVMQALELFRNYDLGVLESVYRKSARSALRLIRKKGASLLAVRSWLTDPPFLKNVPLPSVKLGPFAVRYRSLLTKSIGSFAEARAITLDEARTRFPRIKQIEVDEMNNLEAPTETNSFDNHISNIKTNSREQSAMEGVARTLWGEASSCQLQGLPQFEAIGRIIADRSMAVARALNEQSQLEIKSSVVREENWTIFLNNWVGISRPAPGLKNKPINHLRGLSDFGRKEKSDLHPAAQVISKKGQFSVWNSFSIKKFHTGQFHPNIPDAVYEIQGPQAENDDKALVRILCPQFQTDQQRELWSQAEKLAEEIVMRPESVGKRITWQVSGEILFYTHEAGLPFAKEIKVPYLLVDNGKRMLRGKGRGSCNQFRLFVPKNKNEY
ncbi:MAG: hypothetical protein H7281_00480 [Bacteriovorax sp.]|nr:hypothetical protein [Bacteriovorax sp.]